MERNLVGANIATSVRKGLGEGEGVMHGKSSEGNQNMFYLQVASNFEKVIKLSVIVILLTACLFLTQ